MDWTREGKAIELGFTLLEVLAALLITGIFMMTAQRLLVDQWRGSLTLKSHLEAHYAVVTAGQTISREIRSAQTVEWNEDTQKLLILPLSADTNLLPTLDSYFIDDLDKDGINDLYWKHMGISEPIASNILSWECVEVESGLWNVFLEASVRGQNVSWRSFVRQRLHTSSTAVIPDQEGMLVF
jgi:prepilin-type N-terminal cleavage/methylation domain